MASGGARATSGPPPDPTALRRNRKSDAAGWQTLPAEGRLGPPPDWPLIDVQPREWDLWRNLWTRPQAVMWEQLGLHLEVALLVRTLVEAELPGARTEVSKLARQYLESLGLTTPGMLRNRWRIGPVEAPAEDQEQPKRTRQRSRDRLKVVDGTGG